MENLERSEDDRRLGLFFRGWLERPLTVGAIAPSGRALARRMARAVDPADPRAVIELGAGTGPVTRAILERGLPPGQLASIERHPDFCRVLRERFPGVVVIEGDVVELERLAAGFAGPGEVQAVVSSLPLLSLPKRVMEAAVAQSMVLLAAGGTFVQFTYGPSSPIPRSLMERHGLEGRRVALVAVNLPPASVWHYRRRAP
jgi:phosphatidylethanolamine/phosphatidyl-N-methylethanolamine N-methyltransferase